MVHSDVSVILIPRDAKMDDWKEWAISIVILPVFILGFAVLWIIMVATVLISMFFDWIVCTFKKSMI
jgi:hypothetical protein